MQLASIAENLSTERAGSPDSSLTNLAVPPIADSAEGVQSQVDLQNFELVIPEPLVDLLEVRKAWGVLTRPEEVHGIVCFNAVAGRSYSERMLNGYFNSVDALLEELQTLHSADGICMTLNPVNPDLLARAKNRLIPSKRGEGTSDRDIIRRRRWLVDFDPDRPSGISSTDEQHQWALDFARTVRQRLSDLGFSLPVSCDSGNGAHLLYAIDEPCDDGGLGQRALQGLTMLCSHPQVKVDVSVHNTARLCRLYGTRNCKGDVIPGHPHRMAGIVDMPESLQVVEHSALERLAATGTQTVVAVPEAAPKTNRSNTPRPIDKRIEKFNAENPIEEVLERTGHKREGDRWVRPGGASPSIVILDGVKTFHHSDDDPLHDDKPHDAFDLHVEYECGGDREAALQALGGNADNKGTRAKRSGPVAPHYVFDEGCTSFVGRDGQLVLANFTARIVGDVIVDDGVSSERVHRLEALCEDGGHAFELSSTELGRMDWILQRLGAGAILYPHRDAQRHLLAAIQTNSPRPVPEQRIYAHTGWREIAGQRVFLHAGGAIGAEGVMPELGARLPEGLGALRLPAPVSGQELVRAVRDTLSFVELGAEQVVLPLFCLPWRAVMGSADYTLALVGPTGTFKTAAAALVQQYFGADAGADSLPAGWSSTANALEILQFILKDFVVVVDDFAPTGTPADIARLHQAADRVVRGAGNRTGRSRLDRSAALRPGHPPRGSMLMTGEDVPRGASLQARMLVLQVNPGDIDRGRLTCLQGLAKNGQFAMAMAGYVKYLAGQPEVDVKSLVQQRIKNDVPQAGHARTPLITANLLVGLNSFVAFAQSVGAMNEEEAKQLLTRAEKVLDHVAVAQSAQQHDEDPARRFLQLIGSAIISGRAHLAKGDGTMPSCPERWGWCRDQWASSLRPSGECVGWVVEASPGQPEVMLDPLASYRAACQMAANGQGLSIDEAGLRRRLSQAGFLQRESEGRQELLVRRTLNGVQRKVIMLTPVALALVIGQIPGDVKDDAGSGGQGNGGNGGNGGDS